MAIDDENRYPINDYSGTLRSGPTRMPRAMRVISYLYAIDHMQQTTYLELSMIFDLPADRNVPQRLNLVINSL